MCTETAQKYRLAFSNYVTTILFFSVFSYVFYLSASFPSIFSLCPIYSEYLSIPYVLVFEFIIQLVVHRNVIKVCIFHLFVDVLVIYSICF